MSDDNAIMESLNRISANVSECRVDIKKVSESLYGNGSPENCLIVRVQSNERRLKLLRTILFFAIGAIVTAATAAAIK